MKTTQETRIDIEAARERLHHWGASEGGSQRRRQYFLSWLDELETVRGTNDALLAVLRAARAVISEWDHKQDFGFFQGSARENPEITSLRSAIHNARKAMGERE